MQYAASMQYEASTVQYAAIFMQYATPMWYEAYCDMIPKIITDHKKEWSSSEWVHDRLTFDIF